MYSAVAFPVTWKLQCVQLQPSSHWSFQVGANRTADIIKQYGFLQQPLESKPGAAYSYVNANFMIGGYIVEKVGAEQQPEP